MKKLITNLESLKRDLLKKVINQEVKRDETLVVSCENKVAEFYWSIFEAAWVIEWPHTGHTEYINITEDGNISWS